MSADLAVAVELRCADWSAALPGAEALCRRAVGAALAGAAAGHRAVEVGVVLADDRFVRDLNRRYRGRDAATNVLAFPGDSAPAGEGAPLLLGDVVVAYRTVAAEARDQGKPIADHLCHLVVHGTLHLLGYGHVADADAERMERLETAVLAGLGVPDPYASEGMAVPAT